MRKHMHCPGPSSLPPTTPSLPNARAPPSSQYFFPSPHTLTSSESAPVTSTYEDERREMEKTMEETRLKNEEYLTNRAEKCRQQEIKRKEEEKLAAAAKAAEAQTVPYDEESVRRKYVNCYQYVEHLRGTNVHAYYVDNTYTIKDIHALPRVPKVQPKPAEKRKWREVFVEHDSPFGDTSQLCKGEKDLQWVYM